MKFILKLIISILLLTKFSLESNTAYASTGPNDCNNLIKSFFTSSTPRLIPEKNSILDIYPQLIDQIESLNLPELDFGKFSKNFIVQNKRHPTLKDGIQFVYDQRKLVLESYDWFLREIDILNDPLLETLKVELKNSQRKLNKFKSIREFEIDILQYNNLHRKAKNVLNEPLIIKDGFIVSEEQYHLLNDRSGLTNFAGEFGELYSLVTTSNQIISRGMMFRSIQNQEVNAYQKLIVQATEKFKQDMDAKTFAEVKKIVKKHRNVFFRKAAEYLETTDPSKVNKRTMVKIMVDMIKSKEIDLVSVRGNKIYWAEVKSYKKSISARKLKEKSKKSIYDQLIEHKVLRDLLGLRTKVELVFISPTSEITPDAKRLLNELGYITISAKSK